MISIFKKLLPPKDIKNPTLDRVYRFISPSYVNLEIDFEPDDLEFVQRAAKMRNMNIHQFIEYAVRLRMIADGFMEAEENHLDEVGA